MDHYKAEYIWVDGTEPTAKLRSKTMIVPVGVEPPIWGFDGSSTNQATGEQSDCVLQPVHAIDDPLRDEGDKLVMCEVLLPDMSPHPTNTRRACAETAHRFAGLEAIFGIEQEYTLFKGDRPLGFPEGGYPLPQGGYYCSVGASDIFGREVVEDHLSACLEAGLLISGINGEVMPGQWEFQVGPLAAPRIADELWLARWLLHRVGEEHEVAVSLAAKPAKGDWNGAGAHTNFSTKPMRESYPPIIAAIEALRDNHEQQHRQLRRGNRGAAHWPPRDRLLQGIQVRRLRPRRVHPHSLAGGARPEGLHRGQAPQREHGPLHGYAPRP